MNKVKVIVQGDSSTMKQCPKVIKPSSNQGGGCNPLTVFPVHSKTLKKVTNVIKVISFTSFAVIFMKKIEGTTLPGVG